MEPSPLICSANQSTEFYMIGVSVMKESKKIVLAVLKSHFFMNFVELYKCGFENIVQCNLLSMQKSLLELRTN